MQARWQLPFCVGDHEESGRSGKVSHHADKALHCAGKVLPFVDKVLQSTFDAHVLSTALERGRSAQVDTFPFHPRSQSAFQAVPWHAKCAGGLQKRYNCQKLFVPAGLPGTCTLAGGLHKQLVPKSPQNTKKAGKFPASW